MKKVLITQSQLKNFSGSEIATLEIAEELLNRKYEVTVFSHYIDEPIKTNFKALGCRLATSPEQLSNKHFDLIWIHHSTITSELARSIITNKKSTVVFHHMSKSEPIESGLISKFENDFADKILFNSAETRDEFSKTGIHFNTARVEVFGNPAPSKYFDLKHRREREITRVAVISNHETSEVIEAAELLRIKGITVDFIGRTRNGTPQPVTPELLNNYDVIISIGKTVQYSLAMGARIYCYDKFGGPGYINKENFNSASYYNFSGRGFDKKAAETICKELVEEFDNHEFFDEHREFNARKASISSKIDGLLKDIEPKDSPPMSLEAYANDLNTISFMNNFLPLYFRDKYRVLIALKNYQTAKDKLKDTEAALIKARAENAEMAERIGVLKKKKLKDYVKDLFRK